MKEKKAEKLYLYLAETDDDLLREAEEAGSAAKKEAKILAAPKNTRRSKILRILPAVAACLAVILTVSILVPLLKKGPEPLTPDVSIEIDSLDALNYYGAQVLRAQNADKSAKKALHLDGNSAFRLLSDTEEYTKPEVPEAPESAPDAADDDPSAPIYDEERNAYYYSFDPNDSFTVADVIGFRIRLTNPEGFLAKKLGTGIIDVVLTHSSFEQMITFRSEDGRFFSCLSGTSRDGCLTYADVKYVDGFRVYKNNTNILYEFDVRMENGNAVGFECRYDMETLTGQEEPLDTVEFVAGSAYAVNDELTVTVSELAELANDLLTDTPKKKEI